MSDHYFTQDVAEWISAHSWPVTSTGNSILVLTEVETSGFHFISGFSAFKIEGIYDKKTSSLANVHIQLAVPGKPKATTVVVADHYPLSTSRGASLSFDLGDGYVQGEVSFKYEDKSGNQDINATYRVSLPYAGFLEDTINIAPTEVTDATGKAQSEPAPASISSRLRRVEETIHSGDADIAEQEKSLVKFLKDNIVEDGGIVVTYNPGDSGAQWEGAVIFLSILELFGSIDPATLDISSVLYLSVPIIGRVSLAKVQGSLLDGVSVEIDDAGAKGRATFTTGKNWAGKYDVFVETALDVIFYGPIITSKTRIVTLPF